MTQDLSQETRVGFNSEKYTVQICPLFSRFSCCNWFWDTTEFTFSGSPSIIYSSEPQRRQDCARMLDLLDCRLEIAFAPEVEESGGILNDFS